MLRMSSQFFFSWYNLVQITALQMGTGTMVQNHAAKVVALD